MSDQQDDKCPRCGGSFEATGGKPQGGPYQCQRCACEDFHAPKAPPAVEPSVLIERLRECGSGLYGNTTLFEEAATQLASLAAEREALKADLELSLATSKAGIADMVRSKEAAEALKAERDEAGKLTALALVELAGFHDGFLGMPHVVNEASGYATADENMAYALWFGKARQERSNLVDATDTVSRLLAAAEAEVRRLREALNGAAAIARSHTSETIVQGRSDPLIDTYVDGLERGYRDAVEQIASALDAHAAALAPTPPEGQP